MMTMPSIFNNDIFDTFMDDFGFTKPQYKRHNNPSGIMKTDIKESKAGFELKIDLPGYEKEDIEATIKDGYMTIKANEKKTNEEKNEEGKVIRSERYSGTCSRSFYVGEELKQQDIKAKFANGVLTVFVPKKEEQPKVDEEKFIAIEG